MDVGVLLFEGASGQVERRLPLKSGASTLGRDPTNDIILDDQTVSRFHARIVFTADDCTITDLGSRSGTTVNGEPLTADVERSLRRGDRIRIGPYTIRFERVAVRRPAAPDPAEAGRRPTPRPLEPRPRGRTITPPRARGERSRYLALLPPIYEARDSDGVLNGILQICEQILDPIDRLVIGQLHVYLDPATAPAAMLPWLAAWVDLVLDENWPLERRRELIGRASELYRWRGTRRGLGDYLQIYTGSRPSFGEPGDGQAPLSDELQRAQPADDERPARLVPLGAADRRPLAPLTFRVIVETADTSPAGLARLHQIIEAEKPAHAGYLLYVRRPAAT